MYYIKKQNAKWSWDEKSGFKAIFEKGPKEWGN